MGTEFMTSCMKDEDIDFPAIPPGFGPLPTFNFKKVEDNEKMISCSASISTSESQSTQVDTEVNVSDAAKIKRSLRRKPWINYNQFDNSSGDESEFEKAANNLSSRTSLPKGVVRGCPECGDCQKVNARWRPDDAQRPILEEAPVFYPKEEEFEDTIKYIASIRPFAEPYGICRIVPPPSWKPPCPLQEKDIWENAKFATRVQRLEKLQNRESVKKILKSDNHMRKKRRKGLKESAECGPGGGNSCGVGEVAFSEAETFGFEPGPTFTLSSFQKYADDFKQQYFSASLQFGGDGRENKEPSVEDLEGEYWRVIEKPTEEIEVLYGADLETGRFGSGFPKTSSQLTSPSLDQYINSGWNLNNFPRLPGSVLSYESGDISGVLVPWLYIGMCFSSFCWHVEDHHLYSMNYMHWGAPKLWYGVPGKDALKLEAAMRKHLPDLFEEQPDLLHKLVTQLSPSILKSEEVPVYRCVQNKGEFVLTFPRAYHAGFNSGFNCAEAVNVAPVDWLPHGQKAIELYREQGRKTSISHDKLLLGAAREAVKAHWEINLLKKNTADNLRWKSVCGKDGILASVFKARAEKEREKREFLCKSSQTMKMESDFDATTERECSVCFFDLHLSAAACRCAPMKFACLDHAKQLCGCDWDAKYFLFRYDANELNILVDALEGKLSAIYRWARLDLGLALSSHRGKSSLQVSGSGKLSQASKLPMSSETIPGLAVTSPSKVSVQTKLVETPSRSSNPPVPCSLTNPPSFNDPTSHPPGSKSVAPVVPSGLASTTIHSCPTKFPVPVPDGVISSPIRHSSTSCSPVHISSASIPSLNGSTPRPISNVSVSIHKQCAPDFVLSSSIILTPQSPAASTPVPGVSVKIPTQTSHAVLEKPYDVILALEVPKAYTSAKTNNGASRSFLSRTKKQKIMHVFSDSDSEIPVCQLSQEDTSYAERSVTSGSDVKNPQSAGQVDTIMDSKKLEESNKLDSDSGIGYQVDLSERVEDSCKKVRLKTTMPIVAVAGAGDDKMLGALKKDCHSSHLLIETVEDQPLSSSNSFSILGKEGHLIADIDQYLRDSSLRIENNDRKGGNLIEGNIKEDSSSRIENSDANVACDTRSPQLSKSFIYRRMDNKDKSGVLSATKNVKLVKSLKTITEAGSTEQKNLDKSTRQKGPRMAKVVRRISCNVEPVEYGDIISGKEWSNSLAIFPKGYKSRVLYISFLDPRKMSRYVSEIVDGGRVGPLFMVTLEGCLTEVFVHLSAARCWEMVRDKVNQEISWQHKLGRPDLPPLQPPGSLDGLEMFGFSSPSIVQAIEAMDKTRLCTEYWNSRPYSRFQVQCQENSHHKSDETSQHQNPPKNVDTILRGLLQKATPEELQCLNTILNIDRSTSSDKSLLKSHLSEEIQKHRPR